MLAGPCAAAAGPCEAAHCDAVARLQSAVLQQALAHLLVVPKPAVTGLGAALLQGHCDAAQCLAAKLRAKWRPAVIAQ